MIQEYTKIAIRNLVKKKLRSFLTIIGILISVATIFTLVSMSLGLQGAVQKQFDQLGADKFFISPRGQIAGPGTGGATSLTIEDVDVIERVSGVRDTTYFVAANAQIIFKGQKRYVLVGGIPLDKFDLFIANWLYKVDEGQFLEEGDTKKIMIGSQYKYNSVFDKPLGERDVFEINDVEFKVSAVLQTLGNPGDDKLIYMPIEDFRKLFPDTKDHIDQIEIQINPDEKINDVVVRVEKKLRASRGVTEKTQDFSILTPEELLASFGSILSILTAFLLGIAAISLLVGGIGIANTMYTSVLERTKEIGIMKAIGARNRDIAQIFLIESGILGLVGGVIGIIFGITISKTIEFIAINSLGTTLLVAATPWYLILGCLVFSVMGGALSGLVPSWSASKLHPVSALRYE